MINELFGNFSDFHVNGDYIYAIDKIGNLIKIYKKKGKKLYPKNTKNARVEIY
jgi:hypothetical protein